MSLIGRLQWLFTKFFRADALAGDLDEELHSHIAHRADDLERQGLPRPEAERRARIEFGGIERFREQTHEALGGGLFEHLIQDLRYALRQMRRTPGFALAVIATIALALGANLTVFAFFQTILRRTLPVRSPGELYRVSIDYPGHPAIRYFSCPDLNQMASGFRSPTLAGFTNVVQYHIGNADGTTGSVYAQMVTGDFFAVLGVDTLLGRPLLQRDNSEQAAPVAVISYGLWASRFGKEAGIIGRRIRVQRSQVTIIGVMPEAFRGVVPGQRTDLWMPLSMQPFIGFGGYASVGGYVKLSEPWFRQDVEWLHLIARSPSDPDGKQLATHLKTYVQSQINAALAQTKSASEREELTHIHLLVQSAAKGMPSLRNQFSLPLKILSWLVMFLLLSGCLNIVNLVLARFRAREHEMSVRLSLGSSRGRLVSQQVTENLILCACGALASLGVAQCASSLIQHWLVSAEAITVHAAVGPQTFLFGLVLMLAVCLLISLAPTLRVHDLTAARALNVRAATASYRRSRMSSFLMIAQLAVATATLAITSFLLQTLWNFQRVNLGIDRAHTLSVSIDPSAAGYVTAEQEAALYSQLQRAVDGIPGVISSSYAGCALMNYGCAWLPATVPGVEGGPHSVERNYVGPNYFSTVGMNILAGRGILEADSASNQPVAVVNRAFEKQFLQSESAIGRTVRLDGRQALIVGIVSNARTDSVRMPPAPFVYLPLAQAGVWNISDLEVRTIGEPASIAPAVRHAILTVNRAIPVGQILTIGEETNQALAPEILLARLGMAFTFLSVLIAAVGAYGLISYETGQRKIEFAIRIAVGATRAAVLRRILEPSLIQCAAGCTAGVFISLGLSRLIASFLYGVSQYDPRIYASALFIGLAVSAGAVLLPSWRAASLDPVSTLHGE